MGRLCDDDSVLYKMFVSDVKCLRERLCDDDDVFRDTCYEIWGC